MSFTPFLLAFVGVALLRLALAVGAPLVGDEAYYAHWGRALAWGYYDHPPLIGWMVAPFAALSDAPWMLRMPAMLAVQATAIAILALVRELDPDPASARGRTAATLFLLSPASMLGFILSPDAPLVLASVAAAWLWLRARRTGRAADALLAGVALGIAFFCKYLGVLVVLGVVVDAVRRRRAGHLALVVLGMLPFVAGNVAWNAMHGWANVVFNLFSRNETAGWSPASLITFALCLAWLLPPPLVVALRGTRRVDARARSLATLAVVPIAVLACVAAVRVVGLHWLLAPWALALAYVAVRGSDAGLTRSLRFMGWFGPLHALVLVALVMVPAERLAAPDVPRPIRHEQSGLVLVKHTREVLAAVESEARGAWLAAISGSTAATLRTATGDRPVIVFGQGGAHSRQDDLETDFRALDRGAVLLLSKRPIPSGDVTPWFDEVRQGEVTVRGARFWWARGDGFRYAAYRDGVLAEAAARYHRVPRWLPGPRDPFCERYWPGEAGRCGPH